VFSGVFPLEDDRAQAQDRLWRSFSFFAAYRLILGGVFLFLLYPFSHNLWLSGDDSPLFFWTSLIYSLSALLSLLLVRWRTPEFDVQLAGLLGGDIIAITLLADASGGISSGLGVLLLVSLAASGLMCRGRITLFYAALASIALLLQHGYGVLVSGMPPELFMQVGLLCMAYFAVAWLAHLLAGYALRSEQLAQHRGAELSNMAEANRLLIRDLPDGVLVVNEQGEVRQTNPSAVRWLGLKPGAGVALAEAAPALAALYAEWRRHPVAWHATLIPAEGAAACGVRFLPMQGAGFLGAVIVLEDTQRILEQAQQIKLAALGRLTASIAHEVRNPLSSISYAAELLCEENRAESRDRLLKLILSNVGRLNRLVQDIMQLNRRDRIHTETFDLGAQLPGLVHEIVLPAGFPAETIEVRAETPLPVNFDRGHLEQVLWNLCGNALRHCRQQPGSVILRAWKEGAQGLLEVADDGAGVLPENVAHLFEPFFTTNVAGTGLGLYISRELCEANGARLEYRQPERGGACFRISFGENNEQ
jgi:two-component system sensor histidine kinase PilS (NtrC family)